MQGCCFIGHKDCPFTIKDTLYKTIKKLITEKNVTTFYVGTQGSFDKSDYVICYMNDPFSNTFNNIKEAIRKNKHIENLGSFTLKCISN